MLLAMISCSIDGNLIFFSLAEFRVIFLALFFLAFLRLTIRRLSLHLSACVEEITSAPGFIKVLHTENFW